MTLQTQIAREVLNASDGKLNFFVAGVGTGGTLSGVSEFLKFFAGVKKKIPRLKSSQLSLIPRPSSAKAK